ncbi:MAG: helix-turn-helix domain-containing protein [Bacilli bacterium]
MKELNNKGLIILGQNIRRIRNSKHITLEDLSFDSYISRNYLSDVERGKRNISFINIYKISIALGVNIKELFDGIE